MFLWEYLRNAAERRLPELFLFNARFVFTGVLGLRLPLAELFNDASGAFDEQTKAGWDSQLLDMMD